MVERMRRVLLRLEPGGNSLVTLERVRPVGRRRSGDDGGFKLDPPVNRVLSLGRTTLSALWKAFGE